MRASRMFSIAPLLVGSIVLASGCAKEAEDVSAPVDLPLANSQPVATAPVAVDAAAKYDGMIVHQPEAGRGKDDGWFLVKDGKRRWITEAAWLEPHGYEPTDVIYITTEEFYAIPEDPRPLPETAPDGAQPSADASE